MIIRGRSLVRLLYRKEFPMQAYIFVFSLFFCFTVLFSAAPELDDAQELIGELEGIETENSGLMIRHAGDQGEINGDFDRLVKDPRMQIANWLSLVNKGMVSFPNQINQLEQLMILDLSHNRIEHLGPIQLGQLKELMLSGNPIESVSSGSSMPSLTHLYLNDVRLNPDQIKKLKEAVPPDCIFFTDDANFFR